MAAHAGPQAGAIIFTHTGLINMVKNIDAFLQELRDPDVSPLVRGAAKAWDQNYQSEGRLATRGWKQLSDYTRAIRIWRGYTESHPILMQSGGLYKAAITFPLKFQKSLGVSITTPPGRMNDASPTTTTIYTQGKRVTLTITGSKVNNQTGGIDTGFGWVAAAQHAVPRRPFWFVSPEVKQEMMEAFVDNLKTWKAFNP